MFAMVLSAWSSETPGKRLNDTVTEGKSPVWVTASGAVEGAAVATEASGIAVFPVLGTRYVSLSPSGEAQYLGATSMTT